MPDNGAGAVIPRMVVADVGGAVAFLRDVFGATGEIRGDRRAMVADPPGNVLQIAHRLPDES